MVQAARDIEPAALVQVEPTDGAGRESVPAGVEDRYLTKRIVDGAFDDMARVVKERDDTIVGVLGDVKAFVQRAVAVAVAITQDQRIDVDRRPDVLDGSPPGDGCGPDRRTRLLFHTHPSSARKYSLGFPSLTSINRRLSRRTWSELFV